MSTIALVGMDTTSGQFKIPQVGDTVQLPSGLVGSGSAPSLSLGAAAGSGATSSIIGTNISGKITLNSGTGVLASGTVLTMTLANSFAYPNGSVVTFSPGNANFAAVAQYLSAVTSTTGGVLSVSLALTISSTYIGYYSISGW
jgi:hypothetical protein